MGGSSVRALALVAEVNLVSTTADSTEAKAPESSHSTGAVGDAELLFAAGAKEVLTCWRLDWRSEVKDDEPRHRAPSSQWLSTHIPERAHHSVARTTTEESSAGRPDDADDDDHRYLALTAFGTRCTKTG